MHHIKACDGKSISSKTYQQYYVYPRICQTDVRYNNIYKKLQFIDEMFNL